MLESHPVDVKGNSVDVKGNIVDVKGNSVDVKGNSVDVKGNIVDVKGMVWMLRMFLLVRVYCNGKGALTLTSPEQHPLLFHRSRVICDVLYPRRPSPPRT
eukprot:1029706-Pyramimonas_sp.AAC.1